MNEHRSDIFNDWQSWLLAAILLTIFGWSLSIASARPHLPRLPACDTTESREHVLAGVSGELAIDVFGLHSMREVYSIDEGRSLRQCTAIAVTENGEHIISFLIGWEAPEDGTAFWAAREF